jgi:D-tyrosyl-tRNA(Tyr) deacylase
MRCVMQRVKRASVEVGGQQISSIGPGILCLIGICSSDIDVDIEKLTKKILTTRIFPDGEDSTKRAAWDLSVTAAKKELLLVSQFTLHARLKKPRPDFSQSMKPSEARLVYERLLTRIRTEYESDKVKDGAFGEMMDVSLVNEGPVTFLFDTQTGEESVQAPE